MDKIPASQRALDIEYAIRDIVLPARKLEEEGHKIYKLNIGDPNAYDFDTPEHIKNAYINAIKNAKNGYSASEGVSETLDAIVKKHSTEGVALNKKDIVITTGVTEALHLVFGASFNSGDELLIPGPSYPPYTTYCKFYGATPVSYRTIEEENWQPDIDDIRKKITKKTKAIALISPNNPTGAIYSRKTLQAILDTVGEHKHMYVMSDEIYDKMAYGVQFNSPAAINKDIPMIIFNGISKIYLAPGWRIGYLAIRDQSGALSDIKDGILKQARARLCANAPAQHAFTEALNGPQDHIKEVLRILKERRDYCVKRINNIDGLHTQIPDGAFYMFPKIGDGKVDDKKFVLDILHHAHVLLVHGSGFCQTYGKGHFRLVFLPPIDTLEKAFDSIEKYMKTIGKF
ncbi:MAG: aminotransferase class I/II-fold pyridoxal phosphate-dependent enzyme [Thermoplasmata archaeon]